MSKTWWIYYNLVLYLTFGLSWLFLFFETDHMEMSLLETLLRDISSLLKLSSLENINSEPVQNYYQGAEEILKVLKPIILNAIFDSEITSDEVLSKAFEELGVSVEELLQQFERWQPLSSKAYFVCYKLYFQFTTSKFSCSCSWEKYLNLPFFHWHTPWMMKLWSVPLGSNKISFRDAYCRLMLSFYTEFLRNS